MAGPPVTLGLEVTDTAVLALLVDASGTIVAREMREGGTPAAAVDAVRALGVIPAGVGVALRDPSDPASGDVVAAAAGAARVTAAPRVITRGSAVAVAEQWCGAARGANDVVALSAMDTLHDSVHAGILIGGCVLEGAHGLAGAAGWLALNPVERADYRRLGCLEAEIGGGGIVRRLVWRIKSGDDSQVLQMAGGDLAAMTVRHVFAGARAGDGVAIAVVRDTARYIGMAIGNLVSIVDPEVVVLGGLIADAADLLLETSRVEAARRVSPGLAASLRIVAGTAGSDAVALGAARAAMLG